MARQRRPGHPGTAGDHHRARCPRVRHGQHHLADVASLTQIPQRRRRSPHIKRSSPATAASAASSNNRGQVGEHAARYGLPRLRRGRRRGSAHPGCSCATTPGSRISVLPISRNTPPGATKRSEASTKSPASESSTTSTPRPPVTARNLSSNSRCANRQYDPRQTPSPATCPTYHDWQWRTPPTPNAGPTAPPPSPPHRSRHAPTPAGPAWTSANVVSA